MSANLDLEPDGICVLRISGKLKRSEFGEAQEAIARTIGAGSKPRLLAILDEFEGWERGADWNDLDFLFSHSQEIARIAIVVDPVWEVPALAFAGAGVRRAPVSSFRLTSWPKPVNGSRNNLIAFGQNPPPQRYCQAIPTASKS